MPKKFKTSRNIEFSDTDLAGILHFARFFVFMETAEHELLNFLGTSVSTKFNGDNVGWPRISAKCDYRHPLKFEQVVDIFVSVKRLGTKSVTYEFEFKLGDAIIARGEIASSFCICNSGERIRTVEIPADLREKLGEYVNGEWSFRSVERRA